MFLTPIELSDLTGAKWASRQIKWLTDNGYKFDVGLDGKPKVLRRQVEERQLKAPRVSNAAPKLDWINGT